MRIGPIELHVSRASHRASPEGNGQAIRPDLRELVTPAAGREMYGRYALEEYNPELKGKLAIKVYDRMRRSDAQVRASLKLVKTPVLSAQWYLMPASDSELDREVADFVWWCLHNMHSPFIGFLQEALSCLDFGYYAFEKVFERVQWRPKPTDEHPKPHWREAVKWKRFAPIHPSEIQEFMWNGGRIENIRLYVDSKDVQVPMTKVVLFTVDSEADNPEGMSILRSAYPHWYFKQNLYKVDAIQKERHGIGIPDVTLPPNFSPQDKALAIEMAKNLRANEKAYVVRPPGFLIGFLKPEGNMVDVLESVKHHGLMILQNVLVQFLALGAEQTGSRAVGSTQIDAFQRASRYLADFVRETINSQAIPELVDFNYNVDDYPKLRARRLGEDAELRALSVSMRNFVEPGVITPDPELEAWVRDWADWPMASPEAEARTIEERTEKTPPPREGSRTGRPRE